MTRAIPTKYQVMKEVSEILGTPFVHPTEGSSVPRVFFSDIAALMGIPQIGTMPELARRIIQYCNLEWHDEFSSELAPSGGGGTVTIFGLLQIKNAALRWKGLPTEPIPGIITDLQWEPALDWKNKRSSLPKEMVEKMSRPGAAAFRDLVLEKYQGRCAISGVKATEVIQVAHIVPYYGQESDAIQNAIPMRSDLHNLFDCGYLKIEFNRQHKTYMVRIHEVVNSDYSSFDSKELLLPKETDDFPSRAALGIKNQIHAEKWITI